MMNIGVWGTRAAPRVRPLCGLLIMMAIALLPALGFLPMANLMAHYHVDELTATEIITLVISGSALIAVFFPYLIVVIGTIRFLLAVFGTAFAVAW